MDEVMVQVERRRDWSPCPKHNMFEKQIEKNFQLGEKRMDQLEKKIDTLLTGQAQQALALQALHTTINNGLSGEIRRTKECAEKLEAHVEAICVTYDTKFKEFDEFHWFRAWANSVKDGVTAKMLSLTILGGFVVGMIIALLWLAKHIGVVSNN